MTFEHFSQLVEGMFPPDGSQRYDSLEVRELSPLITAYVGDAYYHLFVRTRLLAYEQKAVRVLNEFSAKLVSANMQAQSYRAIEDSLTDEEKEIFRRGRNAHSHAPRRSASVADYHASTGFEAILGTLYLTKRFERLQEVAQLSFSAAVEIIQSQKEGGKS